MKRTGLLCLPSLSLLFRWCLCLLVALPPSLVYAPPADEGSKIASSASSRNEGLELMSSMGLHQEEGDPFQFSWTTLEKDQDGVELANQITQVIDQQKKAGHEVEVRFLHIAGRQEDPRIGIVASILQARDIAISGELYTLNDFYAEVEKLEAEIGSPQKFESRFPIVALLPEMTATSFIEKVKMKARRFFGMPYGMTKFRVFLKKSLLRQDDPRIAWTPPAIKRPSLYSIKDHFFTGLLAFTAASSITFALHSETPISLETWFNYGDPTREWVFGRPAFALFIWVYAYQIFFPYLNYARKIGQSPFWDMTRPRGQQLVASTDEAYNRPWFVTSSFALELTINAILTYLILDDFDAPLTVKGVAVAIVNAALALYAYVPSEALAGKWTDFKESFERQAKKEREQGNLERARELETRAKKWDYAQWGERLTFWGLIYPGVKQLQFVFGSSQALANLPFVLMGTAGALWDRFVTQKGRRAHLQQVEALQKDPSLATLDELPCEALLVIQNRSKQTP